MRSRLLLLSLALAALAALAPATRAGAAAAPACTSSDLEGSRAPAMLRDHGLDTQDGPLVAGTRYRVVVVQELAIGDNASPVDGSITVTAPGGPRLTPKTANGRPVYDFVPSGGGSVRLVVSWQDEVGSPGSGDVCSATQSFDLPAVAPAPARVRAAFSRGRPGFESAFTVRLRGKRPQVMDKVTMTLRARAGTTSPPRPRGAAFARFTFEPTGDGHFANHPRTRRLGHAFYADAGGSQVRIYPYPNIAFGHALRFAVSLDVRQSGRRIGGLRAGAECHRVQFTGHSAVKCHAVRLARHAGAAALPRCHTGGVAAHLGRVDAGAGQRFERLTLRNRSGHSCRTQGWVGMQLLHHRGRHVRTNVVRVGGPSHRIVLLPGQRARATLRWGAVPGPGDRQAIRCQPVASHVLITPPDETTSLRLRWKGGPVCERGRIEVTPLRWFPA